VARPPKPTAHYRIHGDSNPERHENREYEVAPEGDAIQSAELTGEALEAWQFHWPRLTKLGLATELDSYELTAMCQWWGRYQEHMRLAQDDYRQHNMATSAYKQFRTIASKFGLTPVDRVGLVGNVPTQEDEIAALIAG